MTPPAPSHGGPAAALPHLLLVIGVALLVSVVTFNGAFGSDDVVYFDRAAQLALGQWESADYNGALRYGFNLPAAVFIALFGESVMAANLWPLLCSLIEVAAVYLFTATAMNRRAGLCAALLLATAPLHMAVATRVHADPVVAMFLTVGFVLVYFGHRRQDRGLLFTAGLVIGGVFWAKELAAVTWFAFLPLLPLFRGRWSQVGWVLLGLLLAIAGHGLLMVMLAGDPLHLVKVVLGAMKRNFIDGGQGEDGAFFYLRYLFVDLRHVGLVGLFAALALWRVPRQVTGGADAAGYRFALVWAASLLLVLSVFPVSLSPLRFTMKQTNYLTLFMAPLAVLAGMGLATLGATWRRLALAAAVALGLLLGLLQQADYRVFTANSKALAPFALDHPKALVVGSVNNSSLGNLLARVSRPGAARAHIFDFDEVQKEIPLYKERLPKADVIYAVLDQQTIGAASMKVKISAPLSCWRHLQQVTPTGFGLGNSLVSALTSAAGSDSRLTAVLGRLGQPRRADLYRVEGRDVLCRTA